MNVINADDDQDVAKLVKDDAFRGVKQEHDATKDDAVDAYRGGEVTDDESFQDFDATVKS